MDRAIYPSTVTGRCCAVGCVRIGASPKRNSRSTSGFSSSFTMCESEAKRCWVRSLNCSSAKTPESNKSDSDKLSDLCCLWEHSNGSLPTRPLSATQASDKGTPMGVPVRSSGLNGLTHFLPGFEAAAFKRQGPQHFPPRFDQVEIGRVDELKNALPSGMGQ